MTRHEACARQSGQGAVDLEDTQASEVAAIGTDRCHELGSRAHMKLTQGGGQTAAGRGSDA
jgi:hypothetical protein